MDKTDMDAVFMRRCLQLASLGRGHVSPNPMVGAVVVHRGRIIGEGYHRCYGQPHAEVNAINSVRDADCCRNVHCMLLWSLVLITGKLLLVPT